MFRARQIILKIKHLPIVQPTVGKTGLSASERSREQAAYPYSFNALDDSGSPPHGGVDRNLEEALELVQASGRPLTGAWIETH